MSIDRLQSGISRRFSVASSTYNQFADVQRITASIVMEKFAGYSGAFRIMDVGCGTGILTEKLMDVMSGSEIDAIDVSSGMIDEAKRSFGRKAKNVNWVVGDFVSYNADRKYDLIASNATLHWIDPISVAFNKASELLKDDGMLVFCVMLKGTLSSLVESRSRVAPEKSPAVSLPEACDVLDALRDAGFSVLSKEQNIIRRHYESSKAMLEAISAQGVTGGAVSSSGSSLTRGELKMLMDDYTANYRAEEGGVYADFMVMYVQAVKSDEKLETWRAKS